MCKPGTCWFKIAIVLNLLATLTCLGGRFYFGGPPPTEKVDTGLKLLYISSIVSIFVACVCMATLSFQAKACCTLIFCNFGLGLVFLSSFYARIILQDVKLNPGATTEYTKNYFIETGHAPPFLKTLQEQRKCCGIQGVQDYVEAIETIEFKNTSHSNNNKYRVPTIPSSCCTSIASKLKNCGGILIKTDKFRDKDQEKARPFHRRRARSRVLYVPQFDSRSDDIKRLEREMRAQRGVNGDSGDTIKSKEDSNSNQTPPKIKTVDQLFLGFSSFPGFNVENIDNVNVKDYLHDSGCWQNLESLDDFLSELPLHVREWIRLTLKSKDFYLRLMVVYNFILFFVFNYHVLRYKCRRPAAVVAVIPPRNSGNGHQNSAMRSQNLDPNQENSFRNADAAVGRTLTDLYSMQPQQYLYQQQMPGAFPIPIARFPNSFNEFDVNSNLNSIQLQPKSIFGPQVHREGEVFCNNGANGNVNVGRVMNNIVRYPISGNVPLSEPPPAYATASPVIMQCPPQQGPCNKCIGFSDAVTGNGTLTGSAHYPNPQPQHDLGQEFQNFQPSAPPLTVLQSPVAEMYNHKPRI